jgi:FkbM family methyltransferase
VAYWPFKVALRLGRHIAHPGVPDDHEVTRVKYRDRTFSIEHRRWTDKVILDECFGRLQYDLPKGAQGRLSDQLYREIVESGRKPLILDCGANIGVSVLWLTARYPEAHIVAIEPASDNFELLCRNCAGLNVDLKNVGIGAADGTAYLSVEGHQGHGYQTNFAGEGLPMQILSLDTIMASKPHSLYVPFLLKVDIEGAEKFLFRCGHELLDEFPVILMEPHDQFYPGQGTSAEFFRFHSECGREFAMNATTIASLALHRQHQLVAESAEAVASVPSGVA